MALASCSRPAFVDARARRIVRSMDLGSKAGQLIMLSLPGSRNLPPEGRAIIESCRPGAVLLFGFNAKGGPEALREYTSGIQDAASGFVVPILVAVDHEGGLVQRLVSDGFTPLPSPQESGRMLDPEGVEIMASLSARELAAVGVRMNLAPIAEASLDGNRAFLGSRSYSSDVNLAARLAASFSRGMEHSGVGTVYKHFPGNSAADPHVGLPVLQGSAEDIERELVRPFRRALRAYKPMAVMLSHAKAPAIDPERPSSLSPAIVKLLREDLRFRGVIITDDLEMGALRGFCGIPESAVMAVEAGADMLMFSTPRSALRAKSAILAALASGRLPEGALDDHCERIVRMKLALRIGAEADPYERSMAFRGFAAAAAETAKFVRTARSASDTEGGKAAR
jgi:beta-N-acetylhexosaminidase